jgi:L-Ala-D/L-Glu epimerase
VPLSAQLQTLRLADTFAIARSSVDEESTCVLRLEHDGVVGHGEGAPVDHFGETADEVLAALEADAARIIGPDPGALQAIGVRMAGWDGPRGARMAIDGAVHDWLGTRHGVALWRLFGHGPLTPPTSFTLGIADVAQTVDKLRRAPGFEVYKVKVGGPADLERLEATRAGTPARLRIDGNEGWDLATARDLTPHLLRLGVEFVEQPFPADDLDSYRAYRELPQRLPVLIDEGCRDLSSLATIAGYADGVVIKLAKAGGIREAHRMVHAARALDLRVMLGCMIESQLGISQAAQLAALADYVDLDGHLLIADSPFTGLGLRDGRLVLPDRPGLGVVPQQQAQP